MTILFEVEGFTRNTYKVTGSQDDDFCLKSGTSREAIKKVTGSRDDKVEGGGAPLTWLEVEGQSRKGLIWTRLILDKVGFQPSPFDKAGSAGLNLERVVLTPTL